MTPEYLLHISVQTRSAIDLQRTGPWKYVEHPSTDLMCAAYAIGDGPISVWCPGHQVPVEIITHMTASLPIVAYGATFERAVWSHILAPRYGWPQPRLDQFHCSAAMAATLALPSSFDEAVSALQLPVQSNGCGGGFEGHTGRH